MSLHRLQAAVATALRECPRLARLMSTPAGWEEWDQLPTTAHGVYDPIVSALYESATASSTVLPFSPHTPEAPGPAILPHGEHELNAAAERLRIGLALVECDAGSIVTIVADIQHRYVSSDFLDLLQRSGYGAQILLHNGTSQSVSKEVARIEPSWIAWLRDDVPETVMLPESVKGLITLNEWELEPGSLKYCDFLYCEDMSLIAQRIGTQHYVPFGDLFVEWIDCGMHITPLYQTSVPLVRFLPDQYRLSLPTRGKGIL